MKTAACFMEGGQEGYEEGSELVRMGSARLTLAQFGDADGLPDFLQEKYLREKEGWNLYYDILDALEGNLADHDPLAMKLSDRTRELVKEWRLSGQREPSDVKDQTTDKR
jgi:hypothetical protein